MHTLVYSFIYVERTHCKFSLPRASAAHHDYVFVRTIQLWWHQLKTEKDCAVTFWLIPVLMLAAPVFRVAKNFTTIQTNSLVRQDSANHVAEQSGNSIQSQWEHLIETETPQSSLTNSHAFHFFNHHASIYIYISVPSANCKLPGTIVYTTHSLNTSTTAARKSNINE